MLRWWSDFAACDLGAPRLPGFHACVGGGGEKQTPDWYKVKGKLLEMHQYANCMCSRGLLSNRLFAGIEYLTETKVESVDIKSKSLKLAKGGEDITYDKLIIGTGSTVSSLVIDDMACLAEHYVFARCIICLTGKIDGVIDCWHEAQH